MFVERQISIISFMRKKNLIKLNNIIMINNPICKLAHLRITNWFYKKTLESKSLLLILTERKMPHLFKTLLILNNKQMSKEIFLESK
jgi:hypothetical protein